MGNYLKVQVQLDAGSKNSLAPAPVGARCAWAIGVPSELVLALVRIAGRTAGISQFGLMPLKKRYAIIIINADSTNL